MKVRIKVRNTRHPKVWVILSDDKKTGHAVTAIELHKFDCSLVDLLASYKTKRFDYYSASLQHIIDSFTFVDLGAQA